MFKLFKKKKSNQPPRTNDCPPPLPKKENFKLNMEGSPLFNRRKETALMATEGLSNSNPELHKQQYLQLPTKKKLSSQSLRATDQKEFIQNKKVLQKALTISTTKCSVPTMDMLSLSPVVTKILSPQPKDVLVPFLSDRRASSPSPSPAYDEVYDGRSEDSSDSEVELRKSPIGIRDSRQTPSLGPSLTPKSAVIYDNFQSFRESALNRIPLTTFISQPHRLVTRDVSLNLHGPVAPVNINSVDLDKLQITQTPVENNKLPDGQHTNSELSHTIDNNSSAMQRDDSKFVFDPTHIYQAINKKHDTVDSPDVLSVKPSIVHKPLPPLPLKQNIYQVVNKKNGNSNISPTAKVQFDSSPCDRGSLIDEQQKSSVQDIKFAAPSKSNEENPTRFTQVLQSHSSVLSILPQDEISDLYKASHLRRVNLDEVLKDEPPPFTPSTKKPEMSLESMVCTRCGQGFEPQEKIVNSNGQLWHTQCFVCAQCFRAFPDDVFYEFEGRKYCEHDFQVLFAPCCGKCNEFIIGRVIKAMNNNWHPACFTCTECHKELADLGFIKYMGRAVCHDCNASLKAASLNKFMCHKCHSVIDGEPLRWRGDTYHPYHFNCANCDVELTHQAREVKSRPGYTANQMNELYCLRCHDKMGIPICGACRRPIEERVVTALGKHWHVEHFVCGKCEKPFLGNRHYEKKGQAYCEVHYHELFGNLCFVCNQVIYGDVVTALNKAWCVHHFACTLCDIKMTQKTKFFEFDQKPICKKCYEKLPQELKKRLKRHHDIQARGGKTPV